MDDRELYTHLIEIKEEIKEIRMILQQEEREEKYKEESDDLPIEEKKGVRIRKKNDE